MNCKDVFTLIETLPFREWRPSDSEAGLEHARGCAHCRPALAAARALDSRLAALPEPSSSAEMVGAIMERVRTSETPTTPSLAESPTAVAKSGWSWMASFAGIMTVLGAYLYPWFEESGVSVAWPGIGLWPEGLVRMPEPGPVSLALITGLLFYVVGLFGALGGPGAVIPRSKR
jgi:predicted benzoate:H+ symporter BenE